MADYLQTPFDKAFIRAVEYLYEHRGDHHKFRSRKELLAQFGIHESNYTSIKKGERGVPRDKYDFIKKYLKENFDVNVGIFDRNQGEVLLTRVHQKHNDHDHERTTIESLQHEIDAKNMIIEEKNKFIEFQQTTIGLLQNQVDAMQKTIDNLINKQS
jgi:hypothetical protein